jgi:hypothetical protein
MNVNSLVVTIGVSSTTSSLWIESSGSSLDLPWLGQIEELPRVERWSYTGRGSVRLETDGKAEEGWSKDPLESIFAAKSRMTSSSCTCK